MKLHKFYKEWIDWDDFFGREKIVNRSFEDARRYAQSLHLNFNSDRKKLHEQGKIPKDIPKYPDDIYKNKGWTTWGDFLGTGRVADNRRNFLDYDQAKQYAIKLNLKNLREWREFAKEGKIPNNIPTTRNIQCLHQYLRLFDEA